MSAPFADNYGGSLAYQSGREDYEAEAQFRERAKARFLSDQKMQGLAEHQGVSVAELWRTEADTYMDENWEVI